MSSCSQGGVDSKVEKHVKATTSIIAGLERVADDNEYATVMAYAFARHNYRGAHLVLGSRKLCRQK